MQALFSEIYQHNSMWSISHVYELGSARISQKLEERYKEATKSGKNTLKQVEIDARFNKNKHSIAGQKWLNAATNFRNLTHKEENRHSGAKNFTEYTRTL